MPRTRDGYAGWAWLTMSSAQDSDFGYLYQDPMADLSMKVVVEGAWGLEPEKLSRRAEEADYMRNRTVRLGGAAFESFGSADSPADSLEHDRMLYESATQSGPQSLKILFVPRACSPPRSPSSSGSRWRPRSLCWRCCFEPGRVCSSRRAGSMTPSTYRRVRPARGSTTQVVGVERMRQARSSAGVAAP